MYCLRFVQSSLFHKIEEHVYCVEAKVEALISPLVDISVNSRELIEAVGHLRTVLDEVVSLIIKALYFVILKVSPHCCFFVRVLCLYRWSAVCTLIHMYNDSFCSHSLCRSINMGNLCIVVMYTQS